VAENDVLKEQVRALQDMLNGNCPVLPQGGRGVLEKMAGGQKMEVADDSAVPTRKQVPASPTHSCPGDRKQAFRKRRTQSSSALESRSKPARGSYARKSEPNPHLNIISEDRSITGAPEFGLVVAAPVVEGIKLPYISKTSEMVRASERASERMERVSVKLTRRGRCRDRAQRRHEKALSRTCCRAQLARCSHRQR
jgi:hypothetical protein